MIELVFIIVIMGILATAAVIYMPDTKLQQAADTLISNMKYAKTLAQNDDRFYTMSDSSIGANINLRNQIQFWKAGMWQIQFHLNGVDTKNSYSIYADTARSANTTNFDGRPMDGDIIAKHPVNKTCLSGYSANNLPQECLNNIASEVKLEETFNVVIEKIELQALCKENNSSIRIYFDGRGLPYCGNVNVAQNKLPQRLSLPIAITLSYKKKKATICVSKSGLIYGSNSGKCDNI